MRGKKSGHDPSRMEHRHVTMDKSKAQRTERPTSEMCWNICVEVNHRPPRDVREPREPVRLVWSLTFACTRTAKEIVPRLELDFALVEFVVVVVGGGGDGDGVGGGDGGGGGVYVCVRLSICVCVRACTRATYTCSWFF